MTTILVNTQRTVNAHFLTQDGQPAQVDGAPAWTISNPEVLELIPTSTGFSVKLRGRTEGTCEVTATADADRGEGVRPVTLTAIVRVMAPEATGGEFSFGEPEPVPVQEPALVPDPAPAPDLPAMEELPAEEQAAVEEVLNDATPFVAEPPAEVDPAPGADATTPATEAVTEPAPEPVADPQPADPPLDPSPPPADRPTE